MTEPLLLASASPQRREILERLGIAHVVAPSDVMELEVGSAEHVATENARRKALVGASVARPGQLVLGVDTVVAIDDVVLGKPVDAAQAHGHLSSLSGRVHRVLGGVALARDGALVAERLVSTEVELRTLDDALRTWYVETGEWRGRAGGYAIQARGGALVRDVRGDYLNVVGLPVATLLDLVEGLLGESPAPA